MRKILISLIIVGLSCALSAKCKYTYIVAISETGSDMNSTSFDEFVSMYMNKGYKLYGSLQMVRTPGGVYKYFQPVVLKNCGGRIMPPF